jgi:hypothetical protein
MVCVGVFQQDNLKDYILSDELLGANEGQWLRVVLTYGCSRPHVSRAVSDCLSSLIYSKAVTPTEEEADSLLQQLDSRAGSALLVLLTSLLEFMIDSQLTNEGEPSPSLAPFFEFLNDVSKALMASSEPNACSTAALGSLQQKVIAHLLSDRLSQPSAGPGHVRTDATCGLLQTCESLVSCGAVLDGSATPGK